MLSPPLSSAVSLAITRDDREREQLRRSWVSTDGWRRREGLDDLPAQLVRAVGAEAIGGHHGREPPPAGACHPQDRCDMFRVMEDTPPSQSMPLLNVNHP